MYFSSNLQLETRNLKRVPSGFCDHFRNFPFSSNSKSEMLRLDAMVHNTSVFVAYVLFTYQKFIVEKQVSHLSHQGRIRDKKDFVETN